MAAEDKHPYKAGQVLPGSPYLLGKILGTGGSACVYQAEDQTVGRQVVVKIVRPDVARRGTFTAEKMQREARTLVALQMETEHVVEVMTAGITSDPLHLPYYVMELLVGRTLRAALDQRQAGRVPIAVDEVIGMAIDLGVALDHAHRLRITHLDVKPENAFVHQKRDRVLIMKLLDFGIATMLDETLGGFRGTYRYAAPEQIRGERVSAVTDLYALGLVMYEALAFRRPFEAPGQRLGSDALAHAHCEVSPAALQPLRPDAPATLVALVMQCLEKLPENRPPSAAFLVGRLREIRRQVGRGAPGERSYLETLTAVDAPTLLDATRVQPQTAPQGLAASLPPASEVFVTAAAPPRAAEAPGPPLDTHPPTILQGSRQASTAPASSRPSRAGALAGGAIGIVVGLGIVAALVSGRLSRAKWATPDTAPATSTSASTASRSTSEPPAEPAPTPAASSIPQGSSAPQEHHAPPSPASTSTAASRKVPDAPTPSGRSEARPARSSAPTSSPTPGSSATTGITTQKDWF